MSARESRLYFRIQQVAGLLRQTADAELLEAAGITTAQAAILEVVAMKGGCTQKEAAVALNQREAAVTQMVARLQASELLTRRRSPQDRRQWRLALSEKGEAARQSAASAFAKTNERLDEVIDTDKEGVLIEALDAIASALRR